MPVSPDSSQAGYLRHGTAPPYGEALENLFHDVIVGVTGLLPKNVRPQYQDDPPNLPDFATDWASFRVYVEPTVWNAYKAMLPDGSAYVVEGTEVIRLTVSFYGPNYQALERAWRDGVQVGQNRDELTAAKIGFIDFADPAIVPALLKQKWVKRADVRGTFHRWASRTYPVLTIERADVGLHTEELGVTPITVNPPTP